MSRIVLAAAALALVTPPASAAPQQPEKGKGGTFPYPARAPIVVCVNGYDRTRDRLTKLLTAALPDEAPQITKRLDEEIEKLLEGRKLSAVRKDARLFITVNDLSDLFEGPPPIAVLVPVTGYKEFRDSFLTNDERKTLEQGRDGVDVFKTDAFGEEETAFLVDLKDYAAVTLDKATADGYAGKYTPGTTETMGPELAESFLKSDLAVFVNMDAVNDQFGDQIRAFKGLLDFALQQAQQEGALPDFNKKQMDALKVLMKGAFQGVEDCRAVVFGAEVRPEGVFVRLQARFEENSPSAKLVASENPSPLADLGKLPAGLGIYNGIRFGRTIGEAIRDISQEYSTTDGDAQGAMLIEKHSVDLRGAGFRDEFSASSAPGTSITVRNYKDAPTAVRALTKIYKAIGAGGKVNSVVLKSAPRVTDEAATHRGFTFSEVALRYDFEATAALYPEQAREAMLQTLKRTQSERTTMWLGTDADGKVAVQLVAKNWDAAQALLDKYLDGKATVGADAGYKLTRGLLPADANLIMIAETGAILTSLVDSLRSTGEAIPGFPRFGVLQPAKGEPTYVGLAVTLKGEVASVTAFVPTGAITVGRKVLDGLFKTIE